MKPVPTRTLLGLYAVVAMTTGTFAGSLGVPPIPFNDVAHPAPVPATDAIEWSKKLVAPSGPGRISAFPHAAPEPAAASTDGTGSVPENSSAYGLASLLQNPQGPAAPLLRLLGSLPTDGDAAALQGALARYFRDVGFVLGPDFGGWEEMATISYPYRAGDIDGDGQDDAILQVFCEDAEAGVCVPPGVLDRLGIDNPFGIRPPSTKPTEPDACKAESPHRLVAVSGENGTELWRRDLSVLNWSLDDRISFLEHATAGLYPTCPIDFVVGSVPRIDGGFDILLYRFGLLADCVPTPVGCVFPTCIPIVGAVTTCHVDFVLFHQYDLIDGRTGNRVWKRQYVGDLTVTTVTEHPQCLPRLLETVLGCAQHFYAHADNLVVQPILQAPPTAGVRGIPANTQSALFFEGVGFNYTFIVGRSPYGGFVPILDSYQPSEWAVRINLTTGRDMWRPAHTFYPVEAPLGTDLPISHLSRLPFGLMGSPLLGFSQQDAGYWNYVPCCFDVSGDHVPDLVYVTVEWSTTPIHNTRGPYSMTSRLYAFNGSNNASSLWSIELQSQTDLFSFGPSFDYVGDVTGDGAADVLARVQYLDGEFNGVRYPLNPPGVLRTVADYHERWSIRDGRTGEALWGRESKRAQVPIVLGDADADGGNDLAFFEWTQYPPCCEPATLLFNLSVLPLTALSGRTGATLWEGPRTFQSPFDLIVQFNAWKTSGLPDVNGDGVGDIVVDDPLFLADLTVVHRMQMLDGRDGRSLYPFEPVGTFVFFVPTGDATGDGVDDFAYLNGDLIDLWMTTFDGRNGTAAWSHRLLSPRIVDYLFAFVRIRSLALHDVDGPDHPFFSLQLEVRSRADFVASTRTYAQLNLHAPVGNLSWALPNMTAEARLGFLQGLPDPDLAYLRYQEARANVPTPLDGVVSNTARLSPYVAMFFGSAGLVFLGGRLPRLFRRKP